MGKKIKVIYIALFILIVSKNLEYVTLWYTSSFYKIFVDSLRLLSYCLVAYCTIHVSIVKEKMLLRYLVVLGISIIVSVLMGDITTFLFFAFAYNCRNEKLDNILSVVLKSQCFITTIVVVLAMIDLIPNWGYARGNLIRYSFGYTYPNVLPTIYFYISLIILYIHREKIRFYQIIVINILNYLIYLGTNARIGAIMVLLASCMVYVSAKIKRPLKNDFSTRLLYSYSIYFIALFCILIGWFYSGNNPVMVAANALVTWRIDYAHRALKLIPLSLFPQKISWVGIGGLGYLNNADYVNANYNFVDCSYIKYLYDYGIAFYIVIITLYALVTQKAIKNNNRTLCTIILFSNLYNIFEPRLFDISMNIVAWVIAYYFTVSINNTNRHIFKTRRSVNMPT